MKVFLGIYLAIFASCAVSVRSEGEFDKECYFRFGISHNNIGTLRTRSTPPMPVKRTGREGNSGSARHGTPVMIPAGE